jgi:membrane-associated HD superfamily phosphohydrolase
MVSASNQMRRFAYLRIGLIVLWLLVLFLAVPNMGKISERVGLKATLLIVFVPVALLAGSLLVWTKRSWVEQIRSRLLQQLALAFFWLVVTVFTIAGIMFVVLVIGRVDGSWTFSVK